MSPAHESFMRAWQKDYLNIISELEQKENTMSTLHMETGHPVTADVVKIPGDRIRLVDDTGRTAFELICHDGYFEVRSVDHYIIGDSIHGGGLDIKPRASNSVEIHTPFYMKRKP